MAKIKTKPTSPYQEMRLTMMRKLQKAINDLQPARYRQVITLYYYDGLTIGEVAKAMGKTPSAVQNLLARARKALAKTVEIHQIRLTAK